MQMVVGSGCESCGVCWCGCVFRGASGVFLILTSFRLLALEVAFGIFICLAAFRVTVTPLVYLTKPCLGRGRNNDVEQQRVSGPQS